MEKQFIQHFPEDIKVMYVAAESFPDGVLAAHQKLHGIVPFSDTRGYYGISWSDGHGGIIYKAAAGELEAGEAEQLGLATFIIKKGDYLSEMIYDFQKDSTAIQKTFEKLLADDRIDTNGYCLETYSKDAKDIQCMVKLVR